MTPLPVPSNREEAWRYTNLRGFDPDAFTTGPSAVTLSEDELADGVVFGSLARAAAEHPQLVERHYGAVVAEGEKFAAGNAARWDDGVFLHVAAGVEVDTPLRARLDVAGEGTAQYYRALIVLEPGARATFVEEFTSDAAGYLTWSSSW